MAKIIDPDDLNDEATYTGTTEVFVNVNDKTIRLTVTGNLSSSGVQNENGVTLKALYSFLKEEWKNDPNSKNLAAFPFPLVPITDESFEFVDGWDMYDDAGRYLLRDAGWSVRNTAGNFTQQWAGIIGLGTIETDDQLYYNQGVGATNTQLTGQVNQAVQTYRDDNGDGSPDFDYRTVFTIYVREYAQLYGSSTLSDIGVTSLAPQAYRFPLSTGTDLQITDDDATVSTTTPYTQILIRYFDQAFTRDVDTPGVGRNFGIVIDAGTMSGVDGTTSGTTLTSAEGGIPATTYDGGTLTVHEGVDKGIYTITTATGTTVNISGGPFTGDTNVSFTLQRATPITASAEEIYTKVQYLLRQNSDIDSTDQTVIGKIADELLLFVGDTLICGGGIPTNPNGGGSGVIIEGFQASDTNRLEFYDNGGVSRTYPYVAALTINFGANVVNDTASTYWVWFTYTHSVTGTDLAMTSAGSLYGTLTSYGTVTDLSEISPFEQFLVSGFVGTNNNGMYEAQGQGYSGSVWVKKADSGDEFFTNEGPGPSVTLYYNPFNSTSAILVQDNVSVDMTGTVGGQTSIQRSFNYDGNIQGGRTPPLDAPITAVAIGLNTSQYVRATSTIARAVTNSVSLIAPLERNYANP